MQEKLQLENLCNHPSSTGTVRLDGVEISDWDKNELSPHIGYLPQSIDLFAGRVSQNISRFRSTDKDKLKKVCEIFNFQTNMRHLKTILK